MVENGYAGPSRRQVLTAGALAGATVLSSGMWATEASAAAPPAIFYSPHQDDEALGLAGAILEHKAAGRPVYLVLVTRGENDGLAKLMNTDPCPLTTGSDRHPCAAGGHHGVNWPTDGSSKIVPCRTAEFMASAATLGVDKVINLKIVDSPYGGPDAFARFVATVKSKIASIARQYPGASHKFTAGWLEITDTHKAIADAAVQLAREGKLTDVRFNFVYAYDQPLGSRANGAAYVLDIPAGHMATKRNAIYCYNTWAPSRNLYALGYHSVPNKLESAHNDPHEYVFTLPNNSYQFGSITAPHPEWS
ncbi:PIG-L deacetylase family protein [Kitasatospora sp. NPDC059812]|uniref:PIG-L deacetylase family protein n=1 Tax=Kitasatospora sp. NPDC059812 TaxID=3346958 RepID=UPI00365DBB82